ncbi:unnamed protein product [Blepharisma stoltei]|uniref:E2F/DP family winged-helix DNA-binding domain-containing protein n=1 Tax=Blepharisma stoltei TaxID=1481888 RepID=A0AAU9JS23_9CILI|nr:unnamed protein product [Blepharisma stoltei]
MERNIPLHIERLVYELEHSKEVEETLLSATNLLGKDVTLLQIYTQLGFCIETNKFLRSPTLNQALSLISQEYGLPYHQTSIDSFLANTPSKVSDADSDLRREMLRTFYEQGINEIASGSELGLEPSAEPPLASAWDCFSVLPKQIQFSTPKPRRLHHSPSTQATKFFTPSSVNSTPYSECGSEFETPKSTKGLRYLTTLVRQLVCKHQPTSFKDVALKLIDELIDTEGVDRIKEEKNIRRRVYDAINVLIAAGVLERDEKNVRWKAEFNVGELVEKREFLEKRKREVDAKRLEFKEILNKYLAIQNLINRNTINPKGEPALQFPFLLVSTSDSPTNSMSIKVNSSATALELKFGEAITMFGDMDVLISLKMHKIKPSLLRHFLPSRELLNYCTPYFP